MLGPLISAGATLLGGFLGRQGAQDAAAAQERMAQQNIELQKQFAQEGIRWKVADAQAAGVHPLYALGAPTHSFSPVSIGGSNTLAPMSSAMASMGQDLSRAINATRTQPERDQAFLQTAGLMELESKKLDNEIKKVDLASAVQRLRASPNPPLPAAEQTVFPMDKPAELPRLSLGRGDILLDRRVSNADEFEKRYGETISDWVAGPYIAYRDYRNNTGGFQHHMSEVLGDSLPPWLLNLLPGSSFDVRFGHWPRDVVRPDGKSQPKKRR